MRVFSLLLILTFARALDLNKERVPGIPISALSPPLDLPPTFLPLCGNGRIDTIDDYKLLAAEAATFTAFNPLDRSLPPVSATLFATETCDDGNRVDHDGCSADCMHQDLWVSFCELQTDTAASELETMVFVPSWNEALLSKRDGIYTLNISPQPSDRSLKTRLLVSKAFPVSNAFLSPSGEVLLYSPNPQKLWRLADGKLSVHVDMSSVLENRGATGYHFPAPNDMWFLMHDAYSVSVVDVVAKTAVGTCTVTASLDTVAFLGVVSGTSLLIANLRDNGRISVTVNPGQNPGVVCSDFGAPPSVGSLYSQALLTFRNSMSIESMRYNVEYSNTGDASLPEPTFRRFYLPLGLWVETPQGSPRNWLAPSTTQAVGLSTYIGHPLVYQSVNDPSCYSGARCAFDVSPDYDVFRPYKAVSGSWQAELQALIDSKYPSATAQEIINDAQFSAQWNAVVASRSPSQRRLLATMTHPVTGSLWALRPDGLFELSKSGVLVMLTSNGQWSGKCMPSGVALCPACQWAPAGQQCRPCAQKSDEWAWHLKCQGCPAPSARRLLGAGSVLIEFSVRGPSSPLPPPCQSDQNVWPSSSTEQDVSSVKLYVEDPAACMRELVPALQGREVVVPPHTALSLSDGSSGDSTPVIVGSVVGGVTGLLAVGVGVYYFAWYLPSVRAVASAYHYSPLPEVQLGHPCYPVADAGYVWHSAGSVGACIQGRGCAVGGIPAR